jgi:hypothetical protein
VGVSNRARASLFTVRHGRCRLTKMGSSPHDRWTRSVDDRTMLINEFHGHASAVIDAEPADVFAAITARGRLPGWNGRVASVTRVARADGSPTRGEMAEPVSGPPLQRGQSHLRIRCRKATVGTRASWFGGGRQRVLPSASACGMEWAAQDVLAKVALRQDEAQATTERCGGVAARARLPPDTQRDHTTIRRQVAVRQFDVRARSGR